MKKNHLVLAILSCIGILHFSCKKNLFNNDSSNDVTPLTSTKLIESFEKQFSEKGHQDRVITPVNDTLSMKLIPEWKKYRKLKVNDTLDYYCFELNPSMYNPKTGKVGRSPELVNTKKYLWVGKGKSSTFYRVATYFFEQGKSNKSVSTVPIGGNIFKNFSGRVVYKNLDVNSNNELIYKNGVSVSSGSNQNRVLSNGNGKRTFAQVYECVIKYDCTYFVQCSYRYRVLEVVNVDSCPNNYPFEQTFLCVAGETMTTPPYLSSSSQSYLCQWVDYPDPGTPPVTPPVTPPPYIPCANCTAFGYKCVNGVCELGTKVYTRSVQDQSSGDWMCYYYLLFSDNSTLESNAYVESSYSPCY